VRPVIPSLSQGWTRAHLVVLLLLLLLPCVLFPGALPGPRVVAADEHLSVHHVQRSASGGGGWVYNHQLSDPAVQFRPLRDRIRESWRDGHAPLWNPDLFAGVPLLADGLSAACYPPVLFELLLPDGAAQDLRVWLHLALAGVGAALLAWLLGASAAGGLVAGCVAMLSAFPVCRLLHPHAWVYAWTPWLAWSLVRLARGRGGPVPVALCWAAMLVAGHPQTAVHGGLFAGLVGLAFLRGWRAWVLAILGLVAGTLLAAPALLPFAEQLARSVTVHVRTGNRLPLEALLSLAWPDPQGHPGRGDWQGVGAHLESNLHVGLLALGLALYGLRRRVGRWWVGGAALALAVALGLPLLDLIPANHARLGGVAGLALAMAAGLALPRRRWAWVLAVLLAGELLWARRSDQGTIPAEAYRAPVASWASTLVELQGEGRVSGLGWAIQPDTGMLAGLRDVRGYELPVSRETERFMAALNPSLVRPWFPIPALEAGNRALLSFAAVRYLAVVAGDGPAEASVQGLTELTGLDAPLRLFSLDPEAPRAWLAFRAEAVSDGDQAYEVLRSAAEPRARPPVRTVGELPAIARVVLAPGPVAAIQPVVLEEPWPERQVLRVHPEQPALLVVADAWAPGWKASVDGEPAPLWQVGGAFRGVFLGAGEHEVVMSYRPAGWVNGLRLGGLGLLFLLIGLALSWRWRPRAPVDATTTRPG
jgi:hypothetical protein